MKNLKSIYRITETETSFIFQNQINIHIELDKKTGSFITGNVYDNETTQKLFSKLYKIAINK
jgi:hypothetical protein